MALVGASARPGSLGARMIEEVTRSPSRPRTYLVNPRYADIGGVPCLPALADVPEPVDLALLAVPDAALEAQLVAAAENQARSAVIFGSAYGPHGTAGPARPPGRGGQGRGHGRVRRGLHGVRERGPRAAGHRLRRARPAAGRAGRAGHPLGFGVLGAAAGAPRLRLHPGRLQRPGTGHHGRGLRQVRARRCPAPRCWPWSSRRSGTRPGCARCWRDALAADVPVVLLSVGASEAGQALVAAHSGALAADGGAWEALAAAYGVHRVGDLAELADTLELFFAASAAGPPPAPASPPCTTPAWNARTPPTWPPRPGCRSPRSPRPPPPGWPACSTRAWPRATRWTCGGPAATPRNCSPAAWTRWPPTRPSAPSRWPWTWFPSSTATSPTPAPCSPRPRAPPSRSRC